MNSEIVVKANKFNCFLSVFMLFLMLDTFFILPDFIVVPIPGIFRLSDLSFFVIAGSFILRPDKICWIIQKHTTISLIVLSSISLVFMTALMAYLFFNQSFLTGLLTVRTSFDYLLLFPFLILIRSKEDLRFFLKIFIIFIFFVALLSYTQKVFSGLPIFNYRGVGESQYTELRHVRMGEQRLFFPHATIAVLLYFLTLANLFKLEQFKKKIPKIFFLLVILYVIYLTGTRVHLFTMLFASAFGLLTSKRTGLIITGIVLIILVSSIQLLSIAVSQKGLSAIEENRVAKLFMSMGDTESGSLEGRFFQHQMYIKQFLRSPVSGVGTLRYNSNIPLTYRRYGFYNNNDLGYSKTIAEYGLVGILWIIWLYIYVFRRTGRICRTQFTLKTLTETGEMAKGVQLFFLYVLISGLTIPHFIEGKRIIPLVLALLVLEVSGSGLKPNQSSFKNNGSDQLQ